ncbi:50S ribosomal protein L31e [Candidatus Pacearchaeota archaeon]|nr:50S ribosomal protein L31e [Candidatus Pacearchaeota archaeon]
MAAEKEDKIVLEREYVVPLRKKWLNSPEYKRVNKAMKALKQFLVRHMKIYDRDLKKIKIDKYLNEEMWMRSIRKPMNKIKIKAKKFESGIVKAELAEIPEFIKWKIEKEKKKSAGKIEKKPEPEKKPEEKKETAEEQKAKEEKKEAVKEAGLKQAEKVARERKHEVTEKKGIKKPLARKALQK